MSKPHPPSGRVVQLHCLGAPGACQTSMFNPPADVGDDDYPRTSRTGRLIARVSGPTDLLDEFGTGLPRSPAGYEALAARLVRGGIHVEWGATLYATDERRLCDGFRAWGAESLELWRTDKSLLTDLSLGSWFRLRFRDRTACRILDGRPRPRLLSVPGPKRDLRLRIGLARSFWSGARRTATEEEWAQLTAGYVALMYHRLAGEFKPGQEYIDVGPEVFLRQMSALRRLGFTPLTTDDLVGFHRSGRPLPRRPVVVTIDDAFLDVVEPLRARRGIPYHLFVPTSDVGRAATWLDDERIASWEALEPLSRNGVELGGHSRTHPQLPTLAEEDARVEIEGSKADVQAMTSTVARSFAYPYGAFGSRERRMVADAGYEIAFGVEPGRNGIGTDPYALRRIIVLGWDSRLSIVVKAILGEHRKGLWQRWLIFRFHLRRDHRVTFSPPRSRRLD